MQSTAAQVDAASLDPFPIAEPFSVARVVS
jgi:hypothetical protein